MSKQITSNSFKDEITNKLISYNHVYLFKCVQTNNWFQIVTVT